MDVLGLETIENIFQPPRTGNWKDALRLGEMPRDVKPVWSNRPRLGEIGQWFDFAQTLRQSFSSQRTPWQKNQIFRFAILDQAIVFRLAAPKIILVLNRNHIHDFPRL